nr:hypothetical protein CFP56_13501 [Quercus suber]
MLESDTIRGIERIFNIPMQTFARPTIYSHAVRCSSTCTDTLRSRREDISTIGDTTLQHEILVYQQPWSYKWPRTFAYRETRFQFHHQCFVRLGTNAYISLVIDERQEWTTVVECISASRTAVPPLLISRARGTDIAWAPSELPPNGGSQQSVVLASFRGAAAQAQPQTLSTVTPAQSLLEALLLQKCRPDCAELRRANESYLSMSSAIPEVPMSVQQYSQRWCRNHDPAQGEYTMLHRENKALSMLVHAQKQSSQCKRIVSGGRFASVLRKFSRPHVKKRRSQRRRPIKGTRHALRLQKFKNDVEDVLASDHSDFGSEITVVPRRKRVRS